MMAQSPWSMLSRVQLTSVGKGACSHLMSGQMRGGQLTGSMVLLMSELSSLLVSSVVLRAAAVGGSMLILLEKKIYMITKC